MNAVDASAFVAQPGAKYSVPVRFGMFDQIDPATFCAPNRVIPTIYGSVFSDDQTVV